MTSTPDRQEIVVLIDRAMAAGARQATACAELGPNARTLQRWTGPKGAICNDRRPFAERPEPASKLSDEARDRIVATCNVPEFASLPPSQIVPRLADHGIWIASESSFYRVLRERGQNHRRVRARPATRRKPPTSFEAKSPCQVWSWDMTWLPGPFSTSISSSTSSAGRSSAGKSMTARRPTSPRWFWSAQSGARSLG
jgi:hypothetical protein